MPTGTLALVCLFLAGSAAIAPATLLHLPNAGVNAIQVGGLISGVWAVDLSFAEDNIGAVPVSLSVRA